MATAQVLIELEDERERQKSTLGYDDEHDSSHSVLEWGGILALYTGRAIHEGERNKDVSLYRLRLLQVAAVAVAAVESLDRAVNAASPSDDVDSALDR